VGHEAALTRKWLRRTALLGLAGLAVLAVILGWLKAHEGELVFETALSHASGYAPLPADAERLSIPGASGAPLAAILMRANPGRDSGYWVLHLHGNADSAFSGLQLRHCEALRELGLNVLSLYYRGFGRSPGIASEAHLDEDTEAAYRALLQRGVAPDRIIFWGHSLGSGPAVHLASEHAAAALVLFGAFTSIPDAAADAYPHLPVRWLVGIQFNSLRRITQLHLPVVIAHSSADRVIPFHHAERLYAAARAPKRLLVLRQAATDGLGGHVDALYEHLNLLLPMLGELLGVRFGPNAVAQAPALRP
jgi:uncharacterized protein